MIIREALTSDIPGIITVLKASLGEENLPLSSEIWKFKHIDNPFGRSLVLIAVENGQIAGVRAFMKWKWHKGAKSFSAVRAVDTATHPDFQGKGVFKKLTMEAVELSKTNGDNFVFNTPNDNSRPGYLKMGWQKTGNIIVGIQPAWYSFYRIFSRSHSYEVKKNVGENEIDLLCDSWNSKLAKKEKVFTPKSANYLKWRYEHNPLQRYEVYADKNMYLAGYVKERKKIKELRIVECVTNNHKENKFLIQKLINTWQKKFGVQIITASGDLKVLVGLNFKASLGPVLTSRELNLSAEDRIALLNIENWAYSLGDLELF